MLPGPGPARVRAATVVPGRPRRLLNRHWQILSVGPTGFMPQPPHFDADPVIPVVLPALSSGVTITVADKGRSARARSWAS
jgi:hypothetical protein